MSESRPLSDTDLELLSAYADGALSDSERQQLETRLHAEPTLQAELDALRETIRLIKTLPTLRAPRPYTLTREMVGLPAVTPCRSIPFTLTTTFSAISAAAAMFLVVFGVSLLMTNRSGAPAASLRDIAMLPTQTLPNITGGAALGEITAEPQAAPMIDALLEADSAEMQVIPTMEAESDDEAAAAPETLFFAPDTAFGTPVMMPTFDENTARAMEEAFVEDAATTGTGGGAANAADAAGGAVAQPEVIVPPMMAVPADPFAPELTPTATKTTLMMLNTPSPVPTQAAMALMTQPPTQAPFTSTPIIEPTQPPPAQALEGLTDGVVQETDNVTTEATADTTSLTGIILIAGGVILLGASAFSIILRRLRRARGE